MKKYMKLHCLVDEKFCLLLDVVGYIQKSALMKW